MNHNIAGGILEWDQLLDISSPSFSTLTTPAEIISQVLLILFPIAGVVLFLYLIYGGYNWMLSGGDPKKVAAARGIITNAIIGFILMFASYWIVQFVATIFDIEALQNIF